MRQEFSEVSRIGELTDRKLMRLSAIVTDENLVRVS